MKKLIFILDFCLPAVFMPFKSGNSVYNPRAHKYFHPSGSNDIRLTQPPTIFQLPALPAKSSVIIYILIYRNLLRQDARRIMRLLS